MSPRFIVMLLLIAVARSAQAQLSYPTVDRVAQKARDADRRLILETELQAERGELAEAQAAFDAGPNQEREANMRRHVENVKALRRELDGVAGEAPTPARAIVKAVRPASTSLARENKSPRFWDPYSRTPDTTNFSTTLGRESP